MRDTNLIPRIDIISPSPEMPELRPTATGVEKRMPTPDFFPPPPNPAEAAKLSLRPVLQKEAQVDEETNEDQGEQLSTTKTPSRLTFGEKLSKFRAISLEESSKMPNEAPLAPPPGGLVTSTPAVGRQATYPTRKAVLFYHFIRFWI